MTSDDIDRALRKDDTVTPSPDFTARVMRAVREEAGDLGPIEFPWSRALPGALICLAALVLGIVASPPAGETSTLLDVVATALQGERARLVIVMLAPLLGSWILVRLSLRIAGYQR